MKVRYIGRARGTSPLPPYTPSSPPTIDGIARCLTKDVAALTRVSSFAVFLVTFGRSVFPRLVLPSPRLPFSSGLFLAQSERWGGGG